MNRRWICRLLFGAGNRSLEAVKTSDDGPPFREAPIARYKERKCVLHVAECFQGLRHRAKLNLAGKISRRTENNGNDNRTLTVALRECEQPLGARHQFEPVGHDATEPC